MRTHFRSPIVPLGILLPLLVVGAPAWAQQRTFDLPAMQVVAALPKFARQAGIQIVAPAEGLENVKTQPLHGEFDTRAALERLLIGTGLEIATDEGGVITLRKAAPTADATQPPNARSSSGAAPAGRMRLAQADTAQDSQSAGSAEASRDRNAENFTPVQPVPVTLAEVIVTGTRIRGVENHASQLIVLDRRYINSTGVTTTAGLMETLPQNLALANQSVAFNNDVSSDRTMGAAINLRGIGEGTTLVLVNGRRMAPGFMSSAVDISALPLSAIERVEVLPDGASALYGSDAVGGVVNFVLRKDYEGAETAVSVGAAPGGVNEFRVSQTLGTHWGSGNALISGDYYKRDLLSADERDYVNEQSTQRTLLPEDKTLGVLFSGQQALSDTVSAFADVLFTRRDTFNLGRLSATIDEMADSRVNQTTATLGIRWRLPGGWQLEAAGSYSDHDRKTASRSVAASPLQHAHGVADVKEGDIKVDGPLFDLPGGTVRAAFGVARREEGWELDTDFGIAIGPIDRRINSVFGEVSVPIIGAANARTGFQRLEVSLAARYDDYSTFGSSTDPRFGLVWEPAQGVRFRSTYGTSFVAPKLADHDTSDNAAGAYFNVDPGSPFGFSYQLAMTGKDAEGLTAQESESYTVGIEIEPSEGLRFSVDYYHIDYDSQITTPPADAGVILGNPDAFGSLFIRNPTVEQVNAYIASVPPGRFFPLDINFEFDPNFDPASVEVIVDHRRRNMARVRTRGLDLSVQYAFSSGRSSFNVGLNGVRALERMQRITPTAAPFETVDTLYNPPKWRARANAMWKRDPWSSSLFVNYVGSYLDNRTPVPVSIDSYVSVDTLVSYEIGAGRGLLSETTLSLAARNLFDEDPPEIATLLPQGFDLGFDATHASPLGRLVTLAIQKRW